MYTKSFILKCNDSNDVMNMIPIQKEKVITSKGYYYRSQMTPNCFNIFNSTKTI